MSSCPLSVEQSDQLPLDKWGLFVTILVGESKKEFKLHGGLLEHHSEWFRNRLNGKWGDREVIELPDDEPDVFAIFHHFCYRDHIGQPSSACPQTASDQQSSGSTPAKKRKLDGMYSFSTLAKLYVFADMRVCSRLKCAAMDAYRLRACDLWRNPGCVSYIYGNTTEGCGLRKFVVDFWVQTRVADGAEFKKLVDSFKAHKERGEYSGGFVYDVAVALMYARGEPNGGVLRDREVWLRIDPCTYHDHDGSQAKAAATADQEHLASG